MDKKGGLFNQSSNETMPDITNAVEDIKVLNENTDAVQNLSESLGRIRKAQELIEGIPNSNNPGSDLEKAQELFVKGFADLKAAQGDVTRFMQAMEEMVALSREALPAAQSQLQATYELMEGDQVNKAVDASTSLDDLDSIETYEGWDALRQLRGVVVESAEGLENLQVIAGVYAAMAKGADRANLSQISKVRKN